MTDADTTTKQPNPTTGIHDRVSAVESALAGIRKEWGDAVRAVDVLGDGVLDERDGPALTELVQSGSAILANLGILSATALYVWTQVSGLLGG
jgi:hypothetical protein